jgi:hypothetical protein
MFDPLATLSFADFDWPTIPGPPADPPLQRPNDFELETWFGHNDLRRWCLEDPMSLCNCFTWCDPSHKYKQEVEDLRRRLIDHDALKDKLLETEAEVSTLKEARRIQVDELVIIGFIAQGGEGRVYRAIWRGQTHVAPVRNRQRNDNPCAFCWAF